MWSWSSSRRAEWSHAFIDNRHQPAVWQWPEVSDYLLRLNPVNDLLHGANIDTQQIGNSCDAESIAGRVQRDGLALNGRRDRLAILAGAFFRRAWGSAHVSMIQSGTHRQNRSRITAQP